MRGPPAAKFIKNELAGLTAFAARSPLRTRQGPTSRSERCKRPDRAIVVAFCISVGFVLTRSFCGRSKIDLHASRRGVPKTRVLTREKLAGCNSDSFVHFFKKRTKPLPAHRPASLRQRRSPPAKNQLTPTCFSSIIEGAARCSSPGRALGLGPRGTEFESPHFDQQRESWRGLLFCTTSPRTPMDARTFFAPNHAAFSRKKVPRKHRLPGDLFLFEGLLCPAGDARLWAKDFPTYSGTSSFLQPKTRQRSRRQTRPP